MRKSVIVLLLLSMVTFGQQRSLPPERVVPGPSGTVTLTLTDYNRLAELAARKPKPPEPPPLPFLLSRAAFKLRVDNESMSGTLDIDGEVLQKGPTKVPLASGLTVLEAQQSQKPIPLMHEGSTHTVVVTGPGTFSVSLSVASALTVEAGRASFMLPVPPAGTALLSLEIPGNHASVRIEPGLITQQTAPNDRTIVEATLEPGKPARVWWTAREVTAPAAQREVRFLSDIKTLISVGDSELRVAALCDITVIQGEPSEFRMPLPSGFELTEATGSTLDSSEIRAGELILKVREPARRTHQFLIAIERASRDNKLDGPFLSLAGAQRETGELLVEGAGTMELTATEGGGLRRIDVREAGAVSRSLARFPLQAAFRYHRRPGDVPKLALEWNQFPDSGVLSAVAERATITTLANVEGKSLTEVTLRLRNHAQPFVKVELPQGSTLLSAEVEGEKVKPVQGTDGSRVPLLRAGFRPSGAYTVSFVYLNSGARFGKSGSYEMGIPRLDVPVTIMTWEVFLPDRVEVKQFGGNALPASLFPSGAVDALAISIDGADDELNVWSMSNVELGSLRAGQVGGIVVDPTGAVVAGASVSVINSQPGTTLTTRTDAEGRWAVSGVRSGPIKVKIDSSGFKSLQQEMDYDSSRAARLGTTLEVGGVSEAVTVISGNKDLERESRRIEEQLRKGQGSGQGPGSGAGMAPSQNVLNLQRRVAGVLPVRVDVPRAGKSYRFVRPLVLEEETRISFQYKTK
ncbi:MAG TPA: carboxypeptidase-like regulatory domain-containing protein [Blastocatellia bacterium]|nr:carboxypeptidase-like regulatory domain-containing protein [Blastocatellia bacterium]